MTVAKTPYVEGRKYHLTPTGKSWVHPKMFEGDYTFTGEGFVGDRGSDNYPFWAGYEYTVEEIEEVQVVSNEVLKYTSGDHRFEFPVTASGNVKIDRESFEALLSDYSTLTPKIEHENGVYEDQDKDTWLFHEGLWYLKGDGVSDAADEYGPMTRKSDL